MEESPDAALEYDLGRGLPDCGPTLACSQEGPESTAVA